MHCSGALESATGMEAQIKNVTSLVAAITPQGHTNKFKGCREINECFAGQYLISYSSYLVFEYIFPLDEDLSWQLTVALSVSYMEWEEVCIWASSYVGF